MGKWTNSPRRIVDHKEILFRDVCQVVREYAFVTSELPLIVSLEVHCTPLQQAAMVDITEEIWGEFLLPVPELDPASLASPEQLRRKNLVKVKYVPNDKDGAESVNEGFDDDGSSILEVTTTEGGEKKAAKVKPPKVISRLSRLGIYTRGITFKSLEQAEVSMPNHIFSLSEKAAFAIRRRMPKALFTHNRDFLMRTYPQGMRVDSSNFDPVIFRRAGVQVVALNWQSWDVGMILNEGMFAGSDGYVLKPNGYRRRGPTGESEEDDMGSNIESKKLDRVTVTPDALTAMTSKSTGTSPNFGGEVIEFLNVEGVVPELAFLSFIVMNDVLGPDVMTAWACVRLDRLRLGYRFVRLLDKDSMPSKGILLIKTVMTEAGVA
ncbi:1-phosphatidylinositol-4,5-bisphosphate phosphodiesterase delta-1 [Colletotrichum salicis]|uniref:Phosphoinositide phospholipase C n=1 Tax=Colletotrichum salicis TaxID=1209931 RepID=A0A135UKH4_9PEZI|nr:1-phosphatidylinositol-4,5-bisphosphate phosphodiesterase delta-1 [Colletotrichum salicis]